MEILPDLQKCADLHTLVTGGGCAGERSELALRQAERVTHIRRGLRTNQQERQKLHLADFSGLTELDEIIKQNEQEHSVQVTCLQGLTVAVTFVLNVAVVSRRQSVTYMVVPFYNSTYKQCGMPKGVVERQNGHDFFLELSFRLPSCNGYAKHDATFAFDLLKTSFLQR